MINRYTVCRSDYNKLLKAYPLYKELPYSGYCECLANGSLVKGLKKTEVYHTVDRLETEYLLIRASKVFTVLNWVVPDREYCTYAIICDDQKAPGTKPELEEMTGPHAWRYMTKMLSKYYSPEQFVECLNTHTAPQCKPLHSLLPMQFEENIIHRFENCVYYDLNSAYGAALCEIFPAAKTDIQKIYEARKVKPKNKKILNYFVGMLAHPNPDTPYIGTFYWIVDRTRELLAQRILDCDGVCLYSNTDGAIIWSPKTVFSSSKKLGEFKSELAGGVGTVYIYKQYIEGYTPYILMQYDTDKGTELKGTCAGAVRKETDLYSGKVPLYHRTAEKLYETNNIIVSDTLDKYIITEVKNEIRQ